MASGSLSRSMVHDSRRVLCVSSRRRVVVQYVPPMDRYELHAPGYNYCGPGTNYYKRKSMKVQPMNSLDEACMEHDRWTESRGPHIAKTQQQVSFADSELRRKAEQIQSRQEPLSRYWYECQAVVMAMSYRIKNPGFETPASTW